MKKLISILFILFIIVLVLLSLKEKYNDPFEKELNIEIHKALLDSINQQKDFSGKLSYVEEMNQKTKFFEKQLQLNIKTKPGYTYPAHVAYWSFSDKNPATASAFGTDYLHHFVNNYLIGFEPFKAKHFWIPQYTLTMRLKYQLDADQYGGLKDVWQNSKQAFLNTRGDCEDHAIILADWLIAMGLDARVVLGKYKKSGHAWVIVYKDSQVFLLEATSKQKNKKWSFYPLTDFQTNYHPYCMFNRDYFWLNIGSMYTTRYSGKNWIKKSRFIRKNNL